MEIPLNLQLKKHQKPHNNHLIPQYLSHFPFIFLHFDYLILHPKIRFHYLTHNQKQYHYFLLNFQHNYDSYYEQIWSHFYHSSTLHRYFAISLFLIFHYQKKTYHLWFKLLSEHLPAKIDNILLYLDDLI